jgi:hypothetical protein
MHHEGGLPLPEAERLALADIVTQPEGPHETHT